jgi:hypothetical protein
MLMIKSVSARVRSRAGAMALLVATGAVLPGIFPSCETTLTTLNPCGTIFAFCEPEDVYRIFADVPDFDYDPSCTIPFYGLDEENDAGDCSTTPVFDIPGATPE